VRGGRFSSLFETGTKTHSASWKIEYLFTLLELWRNGLGVDHPLRSSAKVKGRVELYLYCPSGFMAGYKIFISFFYLSYWSNTAVTCFICAVDPFENLVKRTDFLSLTVTRESLIFATVR
jgi:hypothetical protein